LGYERQSFRELRQMNKKIDGQWLSLRQAGFLSGHNPHRVLRLALLGRIRVKVERGEPIRFLREDVVKVAVERAGELAVS
jgi:hypothetical protein